MDPNHSRPAYTWQKGFEIKETISIFAFYHKDIDQYLNIKSIEITMALMK